jgi:hypothetical protein
MLLQCRECVNSIDYLGTHIVSGHKMTWDIQLPKCHLHAACKAIIAHVLLNLYVVLNLVLLVTTLIVRFMDAVFTRMTQLICLRLFMGYKLY